MQHIILYTYINCCTAGNPSFFFPSLSPVFLCAKADVFIQIILVKMKCRGSVCRPFVAVTYRHTMYYFADRRTMRKMEQLLGREYRQREKHPNRRADRQQAAQLWIGSLNIQRCATVSRAGPESPE